MHKLIKRYQEGSKTNTSNGSPSVQTTQLGNTTNFSNWSSGEKIVNDSKALLDKFTKGFTPLSTSSGGGSNLFGKIGNFGKSAFEGLGGTSGLVSLGSGIVNSLLPKTINSKGYDTVNNVLNLAKNIPGIGGLAATGVQTVMNTLNALGGTTLSKVRGDQEAQDILANTDGGYGGFMNDWNEASALSGQRVGMFTSSMGMQRKIWDANAQMAKVGQITNRASTDKLLTAQMNDVWNERTMMDMNGGPGNIYRARKGLKLDKANIIKIHRIINEYQVGGKAKSKKRSMEELVKYANSTKVPFVQRLLKKDRRSVQVPGYKGKSTHLLGWGESDGKVFVYPEVMEDENGNLKWYGDEAFDRALDTKDYLEMTSEEAQDFTENYKKYYKEFFDTPEFKEGGKMNVIPEGSLHARLHHMENAEGLTKKGIPVVSIKEGGEIEQQAEIELNEIIFNLEVTTELEKLMKDGSENAAIEAGKLLVKEIFENTDDRTGLIKQLTEPKEETSEDLVKQHRVV